MWIEFGLKQFHAWKVVFYNCLFDHLLQMASTKTYKHHDFGSDSEK